MNTDEFIEKVKKIHGDKFDYSKVEYTKSKNKVIIICKVHGEFEQVANSHIIGKGCAKCSNIINSFDDFTLISNKIHNNKYEYINYINSTTKLNIKCKEHGIFEQMPYSHIAGNGCPSCSNNKKLTNEKFIEKSRKLHGDKYDYSNSIYTNAHNKVIIICPEHGSFKQSAREHYTKSGCPNCKKSIGELKIKNILIEQNILFEEQKKFDSCRNKNKLPFDFYIESQNLCIEYDGEQHYTTKKFFGGIDGLKYRMKMDSIKNKFCEEYNIKLLRISYKDQNKIEEILLSELNLI